MRISASELIAAQRAKLVTVRQAARAGGDLELAGLCTLALAQGPATFDATISWIGGSVKEGERRTRVDVPEARQYVVLRSDGSKRWTAGEVGANLHNDWPETYDLKLYLGELSLTDEDRKLPWLRGLKTIARVFYFVAEEVAPFTEEMGDTATGLWIVRADGRPRPGDPLFAGASEQEAMTMWTRYTKSRIARSRLSAVPKAPAEQEREMQEQQPPSRILLVAAAERAIGLTRAAEHRLDDGERVPFEDFYTSSRFRESLAHARRLAEDEHILLLSARYGLARFGGWHTRATSDDVPLNEMSVEERRAWARRVDHELLEAYGPGPRVFVVFAGLRYVQALEDAMPDDVQWFFEAGRAP